MVAGEPAAAETAPRSGDDRLVLELGEVRLRIGPAVAPERGRARGGAPRRMIRRAVRSASMWRGDRWTSARIGGVAALAQEELRLDPFSGVVLVFRAKRADRLKILLWDGSGMVLVAKRLEGAKFAWPAVKDGVMTLSAAQLSALFEGLDWRRVHARRTRRPTAAG